MSLIEVSGFASLTRTVSSRWMGSISILNAGETVVLLGANGSGKTTFMLCLAGLLQAASGSIRIAGRELTKPNAAELRTQLGLVFQDADDQLFMPTVLDDVMFGPLNRGVTIRRRNANRFRRCSGPVSTTATTGRHITSAPARRGGWRLRGCLR